MSEDSPFKKTQKEFMQIVKECCEEYISDYCIPDNNYYDGSLFQEMYNRGGECAEEGYVSLITAHLRNLSYIDFLKTPYWKTISIFLRTNRATVCHICGTQSNLQVHHLTYKHHGQELYYLADLIVVCNECHRTLHKIPCEINVGCLV